MNSSVHLRKLSRDGAMVKMTASLELVLTAKQETVTMHSCMVGK